MPNVSLYFEVHQPNRLKKLLIFVVGLVQNNFIEAKIKEFRTEREHF